MPKRIPEEIRAEIQRLYDSGLKPSEIARRTLVSYCSVYDLTKAKQRGFESRNAYHEHLAKQRGFESIAAYHEHLAKQRGFESYTAYQEHLAKQRGFESRNAYQEHLAKQRGFESLNAYQEHLAKQRADRKKNKELSDLIKGRLRELDRTQTWLAGELGVSKSMVSLYVQGKSIPRYENIRELLSVLEIKNLPRSLEELIE